MQATPKEILLSLTLEEFYALHAHLGHTGLTPTQTVYDKMEQLKLRLPRRQHLPEGECAECDIDRGSSMSPPHDASAKCESGHKPHCTCDICF